MTGVGTIGAGTIEVAVRPATAIRVRNAVVDTLRFWTKRPPSVPHSAGTLLTVGALGQLFALSQMVSYWQNYMHPFIVLGVWLALSATLPIMMFVVGRSGGVLSGRAVLPVYGMLVLTDVVVPIETRSERIGNAGWNWSAIAIFLLALAVYRPVLEVMFGSLVHSGGVFAGVALQQVQVVAPGTAVLIAAGAIIPPFAAAQFVSFYVGMLSERELAGQQAAQIEAQKASEAAVDLDSRRRLARVRAEVAPVLQHVARGADLPLDAEHAEAARRAAARLRSQLLAGRDVDWLFWPAGDQSGDDELADDQVVDVRVLSESAAKPVLDDETKAAVGSLIGLLRRHRPWERVAVTLTARQQVELAITVVATGDCARSAAVDPAIDTATRRLAADLTLLDERIVVIEGVVPLAGSM